MPRTTQELANLYALFHECEALEKAKNRCRDLPEDDYRRRMDSLQTAFSRSRSVMDSLGARCFVVAFRSRFGP